MKKKKKIRELIILLIGMMFGIFVGVKINELYGLGGLLLATSHILIGYILGRIK